VAEAAEDVAYVNGARSKQGAKRPTDPAVHRRLRDVDTRLGGDGPPVLRVALVTPTTPVSDRAIPGQLLRRDQTARFKGKVGTIRRQAHDMLQDRSSMRADVDAGRCGPKNALDHIDSLLVVGNVLRMQRSLLPR
jgi:hypothetical protein